ncbi:hypothetical protein F5879DRAFT_990091 [Lentinula edodes]|nr:hypothetical protein F5879DRAFT_990091 [Lentinula edodes]
MKNFKVRSYLPPPFPHPSQDYPDIFQKFNVTTSSSWDASAFKNTHRSLSLSCQPKRLQTSLSVFASVIHSFPDKPPPITPTGYPGNPVIDPVLLCLPPPAKSEVVIDSKGLKYDKMRENQEERNKEEPEPKFRLRVSRMGGYPYGGGYQAIPRGRSPSPSPVAMPTAVIGGAALGMSYEGSRDVGYTNNRAERQAANAERKTHRRMQKGQRKGLLSGIGKAERAAAAYLLEQ